jgi:hypothetical protein
VSVELSEILASFDVEIVLAGARKRSFLLVLSFQFFSVSRSGFFLTFDIPYKTVEENQFGWISRISVVCLGYDPILLVASHM